MSSMMMMMSVVTFFKQYFNLFKWDSENNIHGDMEGHGVKQYTLGLEDHFTSWASQITNHNLASLITFYVIGCSIHSQPCIMHHISADISVQVTFCRVYWNILKTFFVVQFSRSGTEFTHKFVVLINVAATKALWFPAQRTARRWIMVPQSFG